MDQPALPARQTTTSAPAMPRAVWYKNFSFEVPPPERRAIPASQATTSAIPCEIWHAAESSGAPPQERRALPAIQTPAIPCRIWHAAQSSGAPPPETRTLPASQTPAIPCRIWHAAQSSGTPPPSSSTIEKAATTGTPKVAETSEKEWRSVLFAYLEDPNYVPPAPRPMFSSKPRKPSDPDAPSVLHPKRPAASEDCLCEHQCARKIAALSVNEPKEEEIDPPKLSKEDLKCPVCSDPFVINPLPRILYCGHSVCEDCLRTMTRGFLSINCPVCDKICNVSRKIPFPRNFAIIGSLGK